MRVLAFRPPITVSHAFSPSRARVGADISTNVQANVSTSVPPNPPPPAPAPAPPAQESTAMQAARKVGGDVFPVEVTVATVAGGAVGLFFGGWLWMALGAVGTNLAGRFGAAEYCKKYPNPTGYAAGKCSGATYTPPK